MPQLRLFYRSLTLAILALVVAAVLPTTSPVAEAQPIPSLAPTVTIGPCVTTPSRSCTVTISNEMSIPYIAGLIGIWSNPNPQAPGGFIMDSTEGVTLAQQIYGQYGYSAMRCSLVGNSCTLTIPNSGTGIFSVTVCSQYISPWSCAAAYRQL